MHLFDGQKPTTPVRARLTGGHPYVKCNRICMTAGTEEMPDAIARGGKGRNGDDRCFHSHTPLKKFPLSNLPAQSTCLRRNVGTSHSSSVTAAVRSIDSLPSPIRRKYVGRSRSLNGRSVYDRSPIIWPALVIACCPVREVRAAATG